jgi:hypothetical protein
MIIQAHIGGVGWDALRISSLMIIKPSCGLWYTTNILWINGFEYSTKPCVSCGFRQEECENV